MSCVFGVIHTSPVHLAHLSSTSIWFHVPQSCITCTLIVFRRSGGLYKLHITSFAYGALFCGACSSQSSGITADNARSFNGTFPYRYTHSSFTCH